MDGDAGEGDHEITGGPDAQIEDFTGGKQRNKQCLGDTADNSAQYMGAVAIRPIPRAFQSGAVPKIKATETGNSSRRIITPMFQTVPSLWTESI